MKNVMQDRVILQYQRMVIHVIKFQQQIQLSHHNTWEQKKYIRIGGDMDSFAYGLGVMHSFVICKFHFIFIMIAYCSPHRRRALLHQFSHSLRQILFCHTTVDTTCFTIIVITDIGSIIRGSIIQVQVSLLLLLLLLLLL
jgi:hypothetical protein